MPDQTPPTRRRLLSKLNEPVDPTRTAATAVAATASDTNPQVNTPVPDAAARAAARSAALYGRNLRNAQASGDDTRILMAHVDRIRALRNPTLTRAATAALAELINQRTPNRPADP